MSRDGRRYKTSRRTALKLLGASSLTGLAGCTGGGDGGDGGDGEGGSTTTTTTTTTAGGGSTTTTTESTPQSVAEWRQKASEEAAAELEGDDQNLVIYTSERNPEYIDYRTTNLEQTLQEDWVQDAELYEPLIGNFENITGSRGDLVNRYAQEQSQGRQFMDLFEGGAGAAIAQGVPFGDVTQVMTTQELPEGVVNEFQLGLYLFAFGPIYNTEVAEFAPTTYDDLLEPAFADNAMVADFTPPPDSSIPVLIKQGEEYLRQVADQKLQFVDSLFTQMQSVAQGEAALAWQGLETQAYQFLADDFPLELAQNNDVWVWAPQWLQFAAEPPHQWAARLWTDFLVRPEHTAVQTWDTGTLAATLDTANPSSLADLYVEGENQVWSSAKYDAPSNELLDTYLQAMDAPV